MSETDKSADQLRREIEEAEALYSDFRARIKEGEDGDIEDLCRRYPNLEEALRDLHSVAGPPVGTTAPISNQARVKTGLQATPTELPGRFGNFRIVRLLGKGGMGVVYEAIQEGLKRRVALKVLPQHAGMDARLHERFHNEAQAVAKLTHPGIVPIYDFGEDEGGVLYYAMQLIDGLGLDAVLDDVRRIESSLRTQLELTTDGKTSTIAMNLIGLRGQEVRPAATASPGSEQGPSPRRFLGRKRQRRRTTRPPPSMFPSRHYQLEVARIGAQIARALEYAHSCGVLHRDVKPSNLIIDTGGNPWVVDFGLAKHASSESLTQSGEIVGTLRYMAPECFHSKAEKRSDIYSLGLTLYELLALRPAFEHEVRSRLLRATLEEMPVPLRKIHASIARDLEATVWTAIRKDPTERYPSAAEMAKDLECFASDLPIKGRPLSLRYRCRRSFRQHPIFAVLVVVALLVAAGFVAWQWVASQEARGPSFAAFADVDGDGARDLLVTSYTSGHLSILRDARSGHHGPQTIRVDPNADQIYLADLDGDGRIDVAIPSSATNRITVLFNDGGFRRPQRVHVGLPEKVYGVAVLDADMDGLLDLAVVGGEHMLRILRNDGQRRFEPFASVEVPLKPDRVLYADLDGDGREDLMVTHMLTRQVCWLRSLGAGAFEEARVLEAGTFVVQPLARDLDGDGKRDLAFANLSMGSITIFWNEGEARFSAAEVIPAGGLVQSIAGADFDGDGDLDLAVAGGEGHLAILPHQGGRIFDAPVILKAGEAPSSVISADWDEDGDPDLIVTDFGTNSALVFLNEGGLVFRESVRLPTSAW